MKPLNYYMSEVEVPPEVENLIRSLDLYNLSELICELSNAIATKYFSLYNKDLPFPEEVSEWLRIQSSTTWVGVLRWLAMEVI